MTTDLQSKNINQTNLEVSETSRKACQIPFDARCQICISTSWPTKHKYNVLNTHFLDKLELASGTAHFPETHFPKSVYRTAKTNRISNYISLIL